MLEQTINLQDDADVVAAWKAALGLGRQVGFGLFKQSCLSGAVLELCRQVVERGGQGRCALADGSDPAALRVRVVIEGCAPELLASARGRLTREINVGPSLPAVKLHQVAETVRAEPSSGGARLTLTFQQSRTRAKPALGRPPAAASGPKR